MEISFPTSSVRLLIIPLFALFSSACSTLIGNVKPVDEKSTRYTVNDLSRDSLLWMKLDPRAIAEASGEVSATDPKNEAFSNIVSDVTYQSKKTAAIISLNSACRKGRNEHVNLRAFAQELTLGISSVKERHDQIIKVSDEDAVQTTIEGTISGEDTKIRTVVVQKAECIYDLMYISRPDKFAAHEADFTRFVSSLRLR